MIKFYGKAQNDMEYKIKIEAEYLTIKWKVNNQVNS